MRPQSVAKRLSRARFASAFAIVAAVSVAFGGVAGAESAPTVDPPAEAVEALETQSLSNETPENEGDLANETEPAPVAAEAPIEEQEVPVQDELDEPVALSSVAPQTLDFSVQSIVEPQTIPFPGGDPVCPAGQTGFRVEGPSSGTFNDGTLWVQIDVASPEPAAGPEFDWAIVAPTADGIVVSQVFVKGGEDQNLYDYTGQPGGGVTADTGLHAPLNPNNNKWFGLSHIDFCYPEPGPPDLTIEKVTDVETDQRFDFDGGDLGSFDLGNGESKFFDDLEPGTYTVDELVPDGWNLADIVCTDGSGRVGDGVTVELGPGDSVTCTFFNEIIRGDLTIVKETDVETDQRFDFDGGGLGSFDLGDGESEVFGGLLPGDYTVIEDVPDDWTLDDIDCGDADVTFVDDGVSVHLESGDSVTCTFTNHFVRANLIIEKVTDVETDQRFDFDGGGLGPFDLGNGELEHFADLAPGEYSVEEIVPAGWTLFEISCTGTEAWERDVDDVTVTLESGDAVTCTFTNVDLGGEVVVPPDEPGGPGQPGIPTEVLGTAVERAPGTPSVPTQVLGATLPFTGSPLAMLLKIALWLLVLGGLTLAVSHWVRRRRMA